MLKWKFGVEEGVGAGMGYPEGVVVCVPVLIPLLSVSLSLSSVPFSLSSLVLLHLALLVPFLPR